MTPIISVLPRPLFWASLSVLVMLLMGCTTLEPAGTKTLIDNVQFEEIHQSAQFASAVYGDQERITSTLASYGYQLDGLGIDEDAQVQYFLATNLTAKTQVVAIRGTANLSNALADMKIQMEPDARTGINLHRGFAEAAQSVYRQIKPRLRNDFTLYTTGHSLGGAVALILAMYLDVDQYTVGGVTTFGQPKVTDKAGASKFSDLPVKRIVAEKDIVPLLPPIDYRVMNHLNIYWPLGIEIVLYPDEHYSTLTAEETMLRSLTGLNVQPSAEELDAHRMTNYMSLIEQKGHDTVNIPYRDRAQYLNSK